MITSELLITEKTYPSVYFQLDVTMTVCDEIEADIVAEMLKQYSVYHKRNGCVFQIQAQKVTLDGEALVAFLAILHDDDVEISPKIRLWHAGDRRFKALPFA